MRGTKRSLKDVPSDLDDLHEQAEEDRNVHLDDDVQIEQVEGQNLDDLIDQDYKKVAELDQYDQRDIDDDPNYSETAIEDRRKAEREMDMRDRIAQAGRNPAALYNMESGSIYSDGNDFNAESIQVRRH